MLHRSALTGILALACTLLLTSCDEEERPADYVARVGNSFLLEEELQRDLANLPARQDSAEARQQIVERWVTNEVLFQEAERRGLRQEVEVQRMLEDSERSVLVNALLSRLYDESATAPSSTEMQSYYERHKEQLRLRESFVRIRYLPTTTRDEAEAARRSIQQSDASARDSVWSELMDQYAVDPSFAAEISSNFYPESRLFAGKPALREALAGLTEGQIAPIVEADSAFHIIQLAERAAARTVPEPAWIEDELARRLIIQSRKQLYARQVQRLRNEALAREDLEIR